LIIAALIAASPGLAAPCPQGQFYRVRLDQCVRISSPLARPYLGASSSQKNRAEGETIDTANLGEEIETSPEDGPPATSDPLAADPPPDEVDEAAWLMIPLLRAAEARWCLEAYTGVRSIRPQRFVGSIYNTISLDARARYPWSSVANNRRMGSHPRLIHAHTYTRRRRNHLDQVQHPILPSLVRAILDEVIGPDM
jgi:hypothetical protein